MNFEHLKNLSGELQVKKLEVAQKISDQIRELATHMAEADIPTLEVKIDSGALVWDTDKSKILYYPDDSEEFYFLAGAKLEIRLEVGNQISLLLEAAERILGQRLERLNDGN